ncbi:bifunctional oligoribonuclease/PAP phosphatase NrnA [Heliobacterium gestii]|uniref:Bifunctional oligoribonuclease/PAP phosphatase NrnA n=1 Tax=Heliomicrobium gestii TaxID=2699 RepID=A0A845LMI0_HELGE|nr:bifunctional oligoribonuclease/PAP phosphatase NrnA [Heliomicrobium gestii]MBM7868383.1 phosphoesterase RecJ-like protein [Heliomicrobium gestii]MZP44563.1 bifunctional oligoribonuclease/PAP phosphatase NrnA [Heliomicrobium gestii]
MIPKHPVEGELGQAIAHLSAASRILLFVHKVPDGDCLGSVSAMLSVLEACGKKAIAYCDDPAPLGYRFLPGLSRLYDAATLPPFEPDLLVVLDSADRGRIGDGVRWLDGNVPVVNIDHHIGNGCFGDVNWLDPSAPACGEMIFHLCRAAGWTITPDVATALYTAVMTDTGSFQYANTTADTLRLAAELRDLGARVNEIREEVYERKPLAYLRLLSSVLTSLQLSADGRVAWLRVTGETMTVSGAGANDCDGLINYPRAIDGVQVALLFREVDAGQIKVGFRSKGDIDVYAIARRFGGGGHRRASGCTFMGGLDDAEKQIVQAVMDEIGTA